MTVMLFEESLNNTIISAGSRKALLIFWWTGFTQLSGSDSVWFISIRVPSAKLAPLSLEPQRSNQGNN